MAIFANRVLISSREIDLVNILLFFMELVLFSTLLLESDHFAPTRSSSKLDSLV